MGAFHEIEAQASQESASGGGGRRCEVFCIQFGEDEGVDCGFVPIGV